MALPRNRLRLVVVAVILVAGAVLLLLTTRSGSRPKAPPDQDGAPGRDVPIATSSGGEARGRDVVTRVAPPPPGSEEDAIGVTVEGRVLDQRTGAPQAGVDVRFTAPGHEGPRAEVIATSAADGQYRAEISTGRWDVRASGPGVWAPPTRLLVDPPADASSLRHDVLVQRAAILRGHVLHEWADSAAVASATVALEFTDAEIRTALDETFGRTAITGADGAFELMAPPGEITLHATAPDGGEGFSQATVASGDEITIDVMIPMPARVAGVVRDADGRLTGGATVKVHVNVPGGGAAQLLETTTDASGAYVLERVHPGTLTIEARRETAASGPTKQQLSAGARATIDLTLGRPVMIVGRVVTGGGEAVDGARVNAVQEGSRNKGPSVETAADGTFTIEVGEPGTYVVTTVGEHGTSGRTTVEVGPDTGSIEVVLQQPGGIRGLVTGASAVIAVERFQREGALRPAVKGQLAKLRTLAAADGTFALSELAPGVYDLVISAPGRVEAHVAGVVVVEGGWTDVAVTLEAAPS